MNYAEMILQESSSSKATDDAKAEGLKHSYRWESGYEKTWENIKDSEDGTLNFLHSSTDDLKRRREAAGKPVSRLGMMRHLNVVIDCSEAMLDSDLKPTRQMCTVKLISDFVKDYLESNPIGQIGLITTRNKRAEQISELSSNARKHLQALEACKDTSYCKGELSLQNSLELASSPLKLLPPHSSREVLIICGSLTTCDPGNVMNTISAVKKSGIRCTVIGICAEMRIYKTLCQETSGTYHILTHDAHFQQILHDYVRPLPMSQKVGATCVKMAFPHNSKTTPQFSLCSCHLSLGAGRNKGENKTPVINKEGFFCPQCSMKYCELPVECKGCGISLVRSSHLLRPLQHLIPGPIMVEFAGTRRKEMACYGCQIDVSMAKDEQLCNCKNCGNVFCLDCDEFIRNMLRVCPGCSERK